MLSHSMQNRVLHKRLKRYVQAGQILDFLRNIDMQKDRMIIMYVFNVHKGLDVPELVPD